ncbi:MAG: hypothetical protein ACN4GZ_01140 [Acidimicrobiales bacterium]
MKRAWWIVGVVLFLVFLYFTALPGDLAVGREDPTGLAGTYTVNGVDPTGREYSGTVVITSTGQDSYVLEWIITGSIVSGVGTQSGNELSVRWETTAAVANGTGLATYEIRSDGSMIGTRVVDGLEGFGTEEIFPEA